MNFRLCARILPLLILLATSGAKKHKHKHTTIKPEAEDEAANDEIPAGPNHKDPQGPQHKVTEGPHHKVPALRSNPNNGAWDGAPHPPHQVGPHAKPPGPQPWEIPEEPPPRAPWGNYKTSRAPSHSTGPHPSWAPPTTYKPPTHHHHHPPEVDPGSNQPGFPVGPNPNYGREPYTQAKGPHEAPDNANHSKWAPAPHDKPETCLHYSEECSQPHDCCSKMCVIYSNWKENGHDVKKCSCLAEGERCTERKSCCGNICAKNKCRFPPMHSDEWEELRPYL